MFQQGKTIEVDQVEVESMQIVIDAFKHFDSEKLLSIWACQRTTQGEIYTIIAAH